MKYENDLMEGVCTLIALFVSRKINSISEVEDEISANNSTDNVISPSQNMP